MVWGNSTFMVGCQQGQEHRSSHYLALLWHLIKDVLWFIDMASSHLSMQPLYRHCRPYWPLGCDRRALRIFFQWPFTIDFVLSFKTGAPVFTFSIMIEADMLFWLEPSQILCFYSFIYFLLKMNALPWWRWSDPKGVSLQICELNTNETVSHIFV